MSEPNERILMATDASRRNREHTVATAWMIGCLVAVAVALMLLVVVIWLAVKHDPPFLSSCSPLTVCSTCVASSEPPPFPPETFAYNPGTSGAYAFTNVGEARSACEGLSSADGSVTIASFANLVDDWNLPGTTGAQWCVGAYLADGTAKYPMQTAVPGCSTAAGIFDWNAPPAAATCYGVKPPQGTPGVVPFNALKWSRYSIDQA